MADIRDGFKDIFLAGVGALAYGGERANELVNNLIEKGELTVEQGKELNTELKHKANDAFGQMRDEALAAQLQAMTPEQRADFVAKVNELANKVTDDAAAAAVKDAYLWGQVRERHSKVLLMLKPAREARGRR